jgi:hypothetical protein
MNGNTSAKPASASVPSRPKKKVSAIATKVWTTMTAVVGPASRHRLRPIGAVSRGWVTDEASELRAYAQSYQGVPICHLQTDYPSPDKTGAAH